MSPPTPVAPDGIELRHLRAFVAVAEELNFSRAATRLYISQPALSRQISGLERLIGCELLLRSTRHVALTGAGEALLDRTRQLMADLDDAVNETREVSGVLETRAARLWLPVADAVGGTISDLHPLRDECERFHAQFSAPPEVDTRPVNAAGIPALALRGDPDHDLSILYLHGGCYIMGSAFGCRHLGGALAVAAQTGVLVPDYRLAPEHPFPAALEDVATAYDWLLTRSSGPDHVVIVGDSAGAGLATTLLLHLKTTGAPLPGALVLLSPWLDLSCSQIEDHESLLPFTVERLRTFASAYAGDELDNDLLCPLDADLRGWPPVLLQAGKGDALATDAYAFADRAEAHGVDIELQSYDAGTHDFHVFWSLLPEASDAVRRAGEFIGHATAP
jgi:epsilon-lactone hydrolase